MPFVFENGQDFGHPILTKPALQDVLAKRAIPARFFDVRQLRSICSTRILALPKPALGGL